MRVWRPKTAHAARQDGDWAGLLSEIAQTPDPDAWWDHFVVSGRLRSMPSGWDTPIMDACEERRRELEALGKSRSLDAAFRRAMERD